MKDELIILRSPLGLRLQADVLKKKINELEKVNGIVEKLDAHYGFSMLKKMLQSAKFEPVHVLINLTFSRRFSQNIPRCFVYESA